MGLYEVPLSMSLSAFGMATMLANFREEYESKRNYLFLVPDV